MADVAVRKKGSGVRSNRASHSSMELSRHGGQAPQQERSRRTRARLVAAGRRLLSQKDWAEISMTEIAREAKSSVGSLYARFENKQALFDELDEDYSQAMKVLLADLANEAETHRSLSSFAPSLVHRLVQFHRDRRGVIRALVLAARIDREPAFAGRTKAMNQASKDLLERLVALMGGDSAEDLERVSWGLFIVMTMIRERILFPESVRIVGDPEDDRLEAEVVRAFLGYLESK